MNPKAFLFGLGILIAVQVTLSLSLSLIFDELRQHVWFSMVTIAALLILSIFLFFAAKIFAKSRVKGLYIQLIMIAVFLKMLLCLALIIGYNKGFQPTNKGFVWSFLVVYLTSTIYEVIFMDRIGREKNISGT